MDGIVSDVGARTWPLPARGAPAAPAAGLETPSSPAAASDTVPLHKDEIVQMLQNGLPGEQVADMVEESGIDFEPTEDYYKALRKVGADEELINAVRQAKRAKP